MEAITYVRHQVAATRRLLEAVVDGLTDEHLRWQPPGTANQVGTTWLHLLTAEDGFVQSILLGGERLWDRGGWEARLASRIPARGERWDDLVRSALTVTGLQEYSAAVRAATDSYLDGLSSADLDQKVTFSEALTPRGVVLSRLLAHTTGHVGEIAALKGIQGIKGLPF